MKILKSKSFTDFSKSTWQGVGFSLVPENSVNLGLNLDSDNELGPLVSRKGTTLINQLVDGQDILGLHNYRDSLGSNSKLFAVISDGTNVDIYDAVAGTKSLEDDSTPVSESLSPSTSKSVSPSTSVSPSNSPSRSPSISLSISPSKSLSISPSVSPPQSHSPSSSPSASPSTSPSSSISPSTSPSSGSYIGLKTRFLTYLNSCLRLNGVDPPKAFNGSAWVTTGGVFDLSNLPPASKYAIEFKDRVYVSGNTNNPDRIDISGIADSNTRAVSWTSGNKFFLTEQEDGGGGITGLWKVPGYVIIGK